MRFFVATSILCMALPFAASAEEATGSGAIAGSGAGVRTTQDVINDIRALVPGRLPKKLSNVMVNAQKQSAWESAAKSERERLTQHRRDCRDAIRRANRDQYMSKLLQCYRSDLLQDTSILRRQSGYLSALAMIDGTIKANATGAILKLIDAENAIIDGIDAGLFTSAEGLEQAKRNLKSNYREPFWAALLRLEADYELTWVVFMAKNIEERVQEPGFTGARADLAQKAALCLEASAQTLVQAKAGSDRLTIAPLLTQARIQMADCRSLLKNIARKEMEEQKLQNL